MNKEKEIILMGLEKVEMTKKALKLFLNDFKNVKTYDWFGDLELKVFTDYRGEIAAIDINTNEIYIKQ
jgi:hypothetical protein